MRVVKFVVTDYPAQVPLMIELLSFLSERFDETFTLSCLRVTSRLIPYLPYSQQVSRGEAVERFLNQVRAFGGWPVVLSEFLVFLELVEEIDELMLYGKDGLLLEIEETALVTMRVKEVDLSALSALLKPYSIVFKD